MVELFGIQALDKLELNVPGIEISSQDLDSIISMLYHVDRIPARFAVIDPEEVASMIQVAKPVRIH